MSRVDLRLLLSVGAPVPGGRPSAEPGDGARQRRRKAPLLIQHGLDSATDRTEGRQSPYGASKRRPSPSRAQAVRHPRCRIDSRTFFYKKHAPEPCVRYLHRCHTRVPPLHPERWDSPLSRSQHPSSLLQNRGRPTFRSSGIAHPSWRDIRPGQTVPGARSRRPLEADVAVTSARSAWPRACPETKMLLGSTRSPAQRDCPHEGGERRSERGRRPTTETNGHSLHTAHLALLVSWLIRAIERDFES